MKREDISTEADFTSLCGTATIDSDVMLDLASKITGELPAVIDELSIEDLAALGQAVSDFLPLGALMGGKLQ